MYKFNDLKGLHFGALTVKKIAQRNKHKKIMWECECLCGNTCIVVGSSLLSGNTKSCGCLKNRGFRKYGKQKAHDIRLYNIWTGIKDRCFNCHNQSYSYYGGRGISMCEEWENDFNNFFNWAVTHGYKENLSIDRINVNGDYTPENCRWATSAEQANNRTNSHFLTVKGITKTIAEWAKTVGVKDNIIRQRIWKGWDAERAVLQPIRGKHG